MILLDTNVVSALMRVTPDRQVIEWLNRQPRQSVWTTSITIYEVRFGLQVMDLGRRQRFLADGFERLVAEVLQDRIVSFDAMAAQHTARLMATRQKQGRTGELRDAMIAGISLAARATLATRNVRHFEDLDLAIANPWDD